MIDRDARDKMVAAIESYMNDEIKAFAFDDALNDIETKDEAVKEARNILWCFYDDMKDHKIVANKEQWDLMCRFILFLRSDADLEIKRKYQRTKIQAVALCLIIFISLLAWTVGASWLLLLTWVGAGIFTWEIDRRFLAPLREQWSSCSTGNIEVFPFDSVSNIFRAAKSVPDFHKRRFPPKLAQRRIYNAWLERISIHIPPLILLPFVFVGWTVALPFVLLIQLCPVCVNQRVVTIGTGDVVTKSR